MKSFPPSPCFAFIRESRFCVATLEKVAVVVEVVTKRLIKVISSGILCGVSIVCRCCVQTMPSFCLFIFRSGRPGCTTVAGQGQKVQAMETFVL